MAKVKKITGLRFTPHTVSFRMDGEKVRDYIDISSYVPMVGHFSLSRPRVRVDRKIRDPRERRAIALHEAIERAQRLHGMQPHPAHVIAEATETRVDRTHLRMSPSDMHRYSRDVEQVYRQNRIEGVRRRR